MLLPFALYCCIVILVLTYWNGDAVGYHCRILERAPSPSESFHRLPFLLWV